MNDCRNCGENKTQDLGPIGKIAPFFLKRVMGLDVRYPVSPSPVKRWIRQLALLPPSPLRRLSSQFAFAEMQICSRCSFIQTKRAFHDDDIMRLYLDYRSPSYNQERIRYEPYYAVIAEKVGQDEIEIKNRTEALTTFLDSHLGSCQIATLLDYGGSDGRFIPAMPARKFVFEVSDINPVPGVIRVNSERDLGKYSIVLLAHVVEHVPDPLKLVHKVASYVEPGGFLYIETPQEISDQDRESLKSGTCSFDVNIHEHINSYCMTAVQCLLAAAGLEVVATENTLVNVGWAKATHIRALGRKSAGG